MKRTNMMWLVAIVGLALTSGCNAADKEKNVQNEQEQELLVDDGSGVTSVSMSTILNTWESNSLNEDEGVNPPTLYYIGDLNGDGHNELVVKSEDGQMDVYGMREGQFADIGHKHPKAEAGFTKDGYFVTKSTTSDDDYTTVDEHFLKYVGEEDVEEGFCTKMCTKDGKDCIETCELNGEEVEAEEYHKAAPDMKDVKWLKDIKDGWKKLPLEDGQVEVPNAI